MVVQFVQAAALGLGLLGGLGLLLVLEDSEEAEQGCSKSSEAMSAHLFDCQIQQLLFHIAFMLI